MCLGLPNKHLSKKEEIIMCPMYNQVWERPAGTRNLTETALTPVLCTPLIFLPWDPGGAEEGAGQPFSHNLSSASAGSIGRALEVGGFSEGWPLSFEDESRGPGLGSRQEGVVAFLSGPLHLIAVSSLLGPCPSQQPAHTLPLPQKPLVRTLLSLPW